MFALGGGAALHGIHPSVSYSREMAPKPNSAFVARASSVSQRSFLASAAVPLESIGRCAAVSAVPSTAPHLRAAMSEAELAALRAQVLMSMKKREKAKEEGELEEGEISVPAPAPAPISMPLEVQSQPIINPAMRPHLQPYPLLYLAQQPVIIPPQMMTIPSTQLMSNASTAPPQPKQPKQPKAQQPKQQSKMFGRKTQNASNRRGARGWQKQEPPTIPKPSQAAIEAGYAKYQREREAAAAAAAAAAMVSSSAADFLRSFDYSTVAAAQPDANAAAEAAAAAAAYYGYGIDQLGTAQPASVNTSSAGVSGRSMELLLSQLPQDSSSYQQLLQWQQLTNSSGTDPASSAVSVPNTAALPTTTSPALTISTSAILPTSTAGFTAAVVSVPAVSATVTSAPTQSTAATQPQSSTPEAPPALAVDVPNEVEMEVDDFPLLPPVAPAVPAGPVAVAETLSSTKAPVPTAAKKVTPPTRPVPKAQPPASVPKAAAKPPAPLAKPKSSPPVNEALIVHLSDSEIEAPTFASPSSTQAAPSTAVPAAGAAPVVAQTQNKPTSEIERLRQAIAEHEARRKQKRALKVEGGTKPNKRSSLSAAEKGARAAASLEHSLNALKATVERLTVSLDTKNADLLVAEQEAAKVRSERDERESRVQALTAKVRAAREALRIAEQQLEAAAAERAAYGTQLHAADEAVRIRRGDILGTKVVIEKNLLRVQELEGELQLARQLVAEQQQRDALAGIATKTELPLNGNDSPLSGTSTPALTSENDSEFPAGAVPIERCAGVWTVLQPNRLLQDSIFALFDPPSERTNGLSAAGLSALPTGYKAHADTIEAEDIFRRPYESALTWFRSYRLNPQYKLKLTSTTFSNRIDPSVALCRFELNGVCNDSSCPGQHTRDYHLSDQELLLDFARYAQLLPKDSGSPLAGLSPADVLEVVSQDLKRNGSNVPAVEHLVTLLRAGMLAPHYTFDKPRPRGNENSAAARKQAAAQRSRPNPSQNAEEGPAVDTSAETAILSQLVTTEAPVDHTADRYWDVSAQLSPEDYEERLQKDPTNVQLWLKYARQFEKVGGSAALRVLARGLEANRTSEALWLAYLRLFQQLSRSGRLDAAAAAELSSACEDAVKCLPHSAALWLFCVDRAPTVPGALLLCERALRTISTATLANDQARAELSASVRELLLCVVRLECDSMAPARALARIARVLPPIGTTPTGSSSILSERTDVDLACAQLLLPADRASVVLHCAHVAAHKQPPLLGAEQMFFLIAPPTVQSIESTTRLHHARALLGASLQAYVTVEDESSVKPNVPLCLNAVHLAIAMGEFDEARAICDALVSIDSSVVEVWHLSAQVEEMAGQAQEAEAAYEGALGCHDVVDFFLALQYAAFLLRSRSGAAGRDAARAVLAKAAAQCVKEPSSEILSDVLMIRAAYARLVGMPSTMPKQALRSEPVGSGAYAWLCFCAFEALTNIEAEVDALFSHAQLVMRGPQDRAFMLLQTAVWKRSQQADETALLPLVDTLLQLLPHIPADSVRFALLRCMVTLLAAAFPFSLNDHALAAQPRSLDLTLTAADNALQLGIPQRARTLVWRAIHAYHLPLVAPVILWLKALEAAQQLGDLEDMKSTFAQARASHPLCSRLFQYYTRALHSLSAPAELIQEVTAQIQSLQSTHIEEHLVCK